MEEMIMKDCLRILFFCFCCLLVSTYISAEWVLVDSASFTKLLPSGEKCYVSVQSSTNFLILCLPSDNLTDDAETAVEIAPDWLKMDLRDNFRRLDDATQNLYADLIINAIYPFIDEICFEVAHIAPQTLTSSMNPQILLENVITLYSNDSFFSYVDIIDYEGDDYYSTTVYYVLEEGEIQEIELPREIYYWYIVHPKLHKEVPNYINPATGSPADPPTGVFWRDYLMNHNDTGYPLLRTRLDTCQVLWKCEQNTVNNGAVGVITQWILDVMTFQSHTHHDQPVRIYHWHIGTCSVHSYLTSATARAALIPATVNVMYSDNHKINEFWDRRWVAWEPVNTYVDNPGGYENWGWDVASAFNWRGDSFIWDTTEKYTEVCTLNVNVYDNNANPVDGARIKIYSSPCVSWGATAGWTDFDGQKLFLLGDDRTYTGQVTSSIGNYPSTGMETIITNSGAGIYYNWFVILPGTVPVLDISPDSPPAEPTDDYRIIVDYDLPKKILYGDNFDDDNRFSESISPGHIDFFICDEENFNYYMADQSFQAFEINQNSSNNIIDFVLPTSDSWYIIFSNEENIVLTQELHADTRLYQELPSDIPEDEIKQLHPRLTLYPNYPNPFNPETHITFYLSHPGEMKLEIYNVRGQKIRTLKTGFQTAGEHSIVWKGRDDNGNAVSSGIYFYRLESDDIFKIQKAVLMK
jgi:hypothetical protein